MVCLYKKKRMKSWKLNGYTIRDNKIERITEKCVPKTKKKHHTIKHEYHLIIKYVCHFMFVNYKQLHTMEHMYVMFIVDSNCVK